jgi:hypothetical protein
MPNGATARRVWPAWSHSFRPQTLLATVQPAELEGWNVGPWMATARDHPNQNLCCRRRGDRTVEVLRLPGPGGEVHATSYRHGVPGGAGRSNAAGRYP